MIYDYYNHIFINLYIMYLLNEMFFSNVNLNFLL